MIIIGIDPGTLITGYGIIDVSGDGSYKAMDYGCIKPPPSMKITDRYLIIYNSLEELLKTHQPDVLVVETQYMQKNAQSAIKLGMARGMAILAAKKRGIPVFEYAPSRAKRAVVGRGQASKYQVQSMVKALLNLPHLPEPEDAADALALALCHAQAQRFNHIVGIEI